MENNVVFNMTVTLIGFALLIVHITYIALKKKWRKDERVLFVFLAFTAFHFALYFSFILIKTIGKVTSDAFIMGFYTAFYIANNMEVFLLFLYMMVYVDVPYKYKKILQILNISLFSAFVLLDFSNLFTHIFFTSENGVYIRANTMIISQIYQFVFFCLIFLIACANKKLRKAEKVAFALYCLLPLIAIILQNIFKGYAIAYLSILVAIEVLFFFLGVDRNLQLAHEKEKNKDAQIRLMLSQIQPHFVYNSLSAISTLITLDPDKAQAALDDFTEYLRLNLSTLTETRLISFEDELRHIKKFVALEELRFPDRMKVRYELLVTDFYLPPLTVQPLVENALKHGILQRIEGGEVVLRSYREGDYNVVEVVDDGVGFDKNGVNFESNKHFGINNIAYRIEKMSGGSLSIESEPGKGTRAIAKFKKTGGRP